MDKSNLPDWINHYEMESSLSPSSPPISDSGILQLPADCKPPTVTRKSVLPTSPQLNDGSCYAPLSHLDSRRVPGLEPIKRSGNNPSGSESIRAFQPVVNSDLQVPTNREEPTKLGVWIGEHKVLSGLALLTLGLCTSERFRTAALKLFEEDGAITRASDRLFESRHDFRVPEFTSTRSSPSSFFDSGNGLPFLDTTASFSHDAHSPFINTFSHQREFGVEPDRIFHRVQGLHNYRPNAVSFSKSQGFRIAHSLHNGHGNPLSFNWGKVKF
jgi:hypothetical protein